MNMHVIQQTSKIHRKLRLATLKQRIRESSVLKMSWELCHVMLNTNKPLKCLKHLCKHLSLTCIITNFHTVTGMHIKCVCVCCHITLLESLCVVITTSLATKSQILQSRGVWGDPTMRAVVVESVVHNWTSWHTPVGVYVDTHTL